jgi:hypothetical protein
VASKESPLSERLDAVLADLPENAWSISFDPAQDYRVCTIVIDWRLIPGQSGCQLQKTGRLALVPPSSGE